MQVSLFSGSTITSRAFVTTLFSSLPCRTITSITNNYYHYSLVARNLSYSVRYPSCFKALSFCSCRAMSPSVQVKDKIELTEKEKKIFDQFMASVHHFNLPTQLRVAGGWVRDKLLGKDCYDIDIALDDMLGSTFADKVSQYLASIGEEPQGRGVIPSNPDQSKHLETATMRLHGVQIDFVNLRSEKYSENSRIPTQMEFGTAEEDAYRRDLTINSLFYNINTHSVEDLTGRGIEDLKSGKIVTPLPPKETFLDDPLRVLRAIRFGARFRFQLDDELQNAAASDDVKNALAAKISRERIGAEIDLMVSGNEPVKALSYIYSLQLFWVVFSLPPKYEPELPEECDSLCLAHVDFAKDLMELIGASSFTNEQRRLCLYSALFVPIRKVTYKNKKSKDTPIVDHIMRTSLKRKSSDTDTVIGIQSASEKFIPLMPFLEADTNQPLNEFDRDGEFVGVPASLKLRVSIGLLLREIQVWWRVALLIAVLSYPLGIDCSKVDSDKQYLLKERKQVFEAVENAIFQLGLDNIWSLDPLVKGKDIMNVLQLKGGPVVGELQRKALCWQLAHPAGTSEECLDWLREMHQKRVKLN